MGAAIVPLTERPDLLPLVARWRVAAFFNHPGGLTVGEMTALMLAPPEGPEETFVRLEDGEPVGTAGLVKQEPDARQDLSPWLAGVFVLPQHRGRGHASALVRRVEGFARDSGVREMWLITETAGPLYERLGWRKVGMETASGRQVALMHRELGRSLIG